MSDYTYRKIITDREGVATGEKIVNVPDEVVNQIRADAIDDFVHKVKEHHYVLHYVLSDVIKSTDYGMFTVNIEQIAEELKAGVKNE